MAMVDVFGSFLDERPQYKLDVFVLAYIYADGVVRTGAQNTLK